MRWAPSTMMSYQLKTWRCMVASARLHPLTDELRNHVINNVSFRDYMEVNPEVPLLTCCSSSLCQEQTVRFAEPFYSSLPNVALQPPTGFS